MLSFAGPSSVFARARQLKIRTAGRWRFFPLPPSGHPCFEDRWVSPNTLPPLSGTQTIAEKPLLLACCRFHAFSGTSRHFSGARCCGCFAGRLATSFLATFGPSLSTHLPYLLPAFELTALWLHFQAQVRSLRGGYVPPASAFPPFPLPAASSKQAVSPLWTCGESLAAAACS